MSSLILPGSDEFKQTLTDIKNKAPRKSPKPNPAETDLIGRSFMLNTAVRKTFQCGGFSVGPLRPIGIVTHETQQFQIRQAVANDILVDVTDKNIVKKGFKGKGGQHTGVKEEETGKRVFVGRDKRGNIYTAIPKTEKQAETWERQIAKTGHIKGVKYDPANVTGIVLITEEVIESSTPQPAQPKKKATKNVRTRSRTGNAKRSGK